MQSGIRKLSVCDRLPLGSSSSGRPSRLHRVRKFFSACGCKPALFLRRRFGWRSSLPLGPPCSCCCRELRASRSRHRLAPARSLLELGAAALEALEPPPAESEGNPAFEGVDLVPYCKSFR